MILASHNTMTYLKPMHWYHRLFKCIYKCQDRGLVMQHAMGARYFDFRISFHHGIRPVFRHGLVKFNANPEEMLGWLNHMGDCIVRLVLEKNNGEDDEDLFAMYADYWQEKYKNIIFTCGEDKKSKKVLYKFENTFPVEEHYGSVRGKWFERIFPKLYAKRHNKELFERYKNSDCYLMIDYI